MNAFLEHSQLGYHQLRKHWVGVERLLLNNLNSDRIVRSCSHGLANLSETAFSNDVLKLVHFVDVLHLFKILEIFHIRRISQAALIKKLSLLMSVHDFTIS